MKSLAFLLTAVLLTAPLQTLAADSHDHGATRHKIELNAGKKWSTDAPLRQGMGAIRTSIAAALPSAHAGKLGAGEYNALGKDIGGQVAYIVKNCKLDPKADAQLHIVIADIMAGVEMMEGKPDEKNRAAGAVKIAQALNTYGKHFDHAGWQAIKLPH